MNEWPVFSEQREAERQQKREVLLLAAVRMFNSRGYHDTSLEEIASSLGVSKPTIYHHLGNKEQVMFQVLSRGVDLLLEAARSAALAPGNGAERLATYLRAYTKIIMSDFGRCMVRTTDETLSAERAVEFRGLKEQVMLKLREFLAAGVADGSIRPCDARATSCLVTAAVCWPAWVHSTELDERLTPSVDGVVDLLINGPSPR